MPSRDDPPHTGQPDSPSVSEPVPDAAPADDGTAHPNRTTVRPVAPPADGRITVTMPDGRQPAAPAPPPVADAVDGYETLAELGRGGMGVVYKARQLGLNRLVALKLMLGGSRGGRSFLHRFMVEAEAVAAIKHENVVEVYEYGKSVNGHPFLALEFCPGGSLADRLARLREVPRTEDSARQVAALVAQVARGVAAVHAQGIVHRDLNPYNVLLDENGIPKIADFGLAKRGAGADVTQVGDVVGTPAYMSPEQARGDSKFVGPQADVWALGVMLHEALTGKELFTGTLQEVFAKVLNSHPTAPSRVVRTIPRDLDLICLKCLAPEPYERYPTAKELADDLERFVRDEAISVYPPGPLEDALRWVRRNKAVSAAAAIVFLALAIATGVSFHSSEKAREEQKRTAEALERVREQERLKAEALEVSLERQNKLKRANALARDRARRGVSTYNALLDDLEKKLARGGLEEHRTELLSSAVTALEQLVADKGLGADYTIVAAYRLMGELSLRLPDTARARANFAHAVEEARAVRRGADDPDEKRAADHDLGRSLVQLADVLVKLDKSGEALPKIDEAVALFAALAEDASDTRARAALNDARESRAKLAPPLAPPPRAVKPEHQGRQRGSVDM